VAAGVVIGGKTYPLLDPISGDPIPVFGVKDHRQEFRAGDGYNKKRREEINLGVFHWTGSENSIETMVNTLRKRKLGVEFAISPFGSLYQFCDMMEVNTADAGIANSRSWGVEIVNAGTRRASTLWREPRYRKPPMGPRQGYDTVIHGRKVRCWDFYVQQKLTAFALNKLISDALETYPPSVHVDPQVLDIKAKGESAGHIVQGAVGHYNISRKKLDPGTRFMHELKQFMETGAPACVA
jgi:hypothetical protein